MERCKSMSHTDTENGQVQDAAEEALMDQDAPNEEGEQDAPVEGEEEALALSIEDQLAEALDEIEALRSEMDAHRDRALRAVAEAENTRRIAQRDRENAAKYAAEPLAKDLLEVGENLKRALSAVDPGEAEANATLKQVVQGLTMVQREFEAAFAKHQIEIIDPLGEAFDPNAHQAMGEMVTDQVEPGKVAVCFARGYKLRDRLLRPAMVQLAKAPE